MTAEVVLLIAGLGFLGVALLGGGLRVLEIVIPPISPPFRVAIGFLGALLFMLGLLINLGIIRRSGDEAPMAPDGTAVAVAPTASVPAQTPEPAPVALPTPTVDANAPSQLGTPLPAATDSVNATTAARITEVGRWGKGVPAAIAWSPDSRFLAVGSALGVYLLDAATGRELRLLATDDEVYSVAISSRGVIAAGLEGGEVQQWALGGGLLPILSGPQRAVAELAFAPDGELVAAASCEQSDATTRACLAGVVHVWRSDNGELKLTLAGHQNSVSGIVFAPDGTTLVSASSDKTIRIWDLTSGALLRTIDSGTSTYEVAYATDPQSPIIALSSYGAVKLWRADTGAELPTFKIAPESWTRTISFSPDGKTLAAAAFDGTVRLMGMDGSSLGDFDSFRSRSIAFAPDGRSLLALGENGVLRLWEAASRRELWRNETFLNAIPSVAFLPDGDTVVVGQNSYAPAQLRRVRDGSLVSTLGAPGDSRLGWTLSVAVSPDGSTVATAGSPPVIQLWRVSDGALLYTLEGHEDLVRSLAFSADGKHLFSGSEDKTVRLWSVADGRLVQTLAEHTGEVFRVAVSPDGATVASGATDNTVRLWAFDGSDLSFVRSLEGHADQVRGLAFSPDGRTLASASRDGAVRTWAVDSGEARAAFTLEGAWATLAYTADGSALLVADNDSSQILAVDAADGAVLTRLPVASRFAFLDNVVVDRDGLTVLAGLWNGQVHVWQVRQ